MTQTKNINSQPNVQQMSPSMSQDDIVSTMNSIPIIQTNQKDSIQATVVPQPEINVQPNINSNIVQDSNSIPEIKPIVPKHINMQPIQQSNMNPLQQQVVNQQFSQPPIANGFIEQNNIVQPQSENTNINNQGI